MPAEIVTAVYKAKPGKEAELRDLLARHGKALAGSGLTTARPRIVAKAQGGFYLEIFEWKDGAASAHAAHAHPDIGGIWQAMDLVCDFACLAELKESTRPFPHFAPLDAV
jgi:hypothetical protein